MVVGVERLSELEHYVVRDVDDVVDGSHAGGDKTRLHPGGRRADLDAAQQRRGEPRARAVIFDAHVETLRRPRRKPVDGWLTEARAEEGRDLAGDADDPEAIGAIRLEVERKDCLTEDLAERHAHGEIRFEDVDPLVLVAEAELLLRE